MSATLADIAKATGTSISTVSRVLCDAPAAKRISQATRERIAAAARQLGYRPNLLARSLRTRKTHTVALIVSDIANPWFGALASMVEQRLHRDGYSTIVCNSCEDAELEQEYLRMLPQKGIDALIVVPLATTREQLLRHLPEGLPVVVVDRLVEGMPSGATTDQKQSAIALCDALDSIGVKKVGLIRGPAHVFTHRLRAQMVSERFEVVLDHEGPAQRETGREGWAKIAKTDAQAIVCTNNFLGQGAIEAMPLVGEPLPLACFDDLPMMNFLPIPVVCSSQDVERIAVASVELALEQIENPGISRRIVVPAQLKANPAFTRLQQRHPVKKERSK